MTGWCSGPAGRPVPTPGASRVPGDGRTGALCPPVLAERTSDGDEVTGLGEAVGVMLSQHAAAAGEGVALEVAGLLMVAEQP